MSAGTRIKMLIVLCAVVTTASAQIPKSGTYEYSVVFAEWNGNHWGRLNSLGKLIASISLS